VLLVVQHELHIRHQEVEHPGFFRQHKLKSTLYADTEATMLDARTNLTMFQKQLDENRGAEVNDGADQNSLLPHKRQLRYADTEGTMLHLVINLTKFEK
jgi:hypothetical protein